jgi:hypothetical protein
MKLFKVMTQGMKSNCTGVAYGTAYVVASDPTEAYKKLRRFLDNEDLGFRSERELDTIEVIADEEQYNDVGFILYT